MSDQLDRTAKIELLHALGIYLNKRDERLGAHIHRASVDNPWFTKESIHTAIDGIASHFLQRDKLRAWLTDYPEREDPLRTVGIVAAGNIPLVCFHDVLCAFVSGNIAQVKLSEKDKYLLPFICKWMVEIEPRVQRYVEFVDKLADFDAVIATGSNNTARYFEQYFGKYPNIIRRNRNAVAVLKGEESVEELVALGQDVFTHFGLGCRNVSHVFVPDGYDFGQMLDAFNQFKDVADHPKYRNNLDYNVAIVILNKEPHISSPHLVLIQSEQLISPVGTLHYSFYQDDQTLAAKLKSHSEEIQCVVSGDDLPELHTVRFGEAQRPALDDYADGINTLEFLFQLDEYV